MTKFVVQRRPDPRLPWETLVSFDMTLFKGDPPHRMEMWVDPDGRGRISCAGQVLASFPVERDMAYRYGLDEPSSMMSIGDGGGGNDWVVRGWLERLLSKSGRWRR